METEISIMNTLEFEIHYHSQYRFLERYAKVLSLGQIEFYMSQYILELALIDTKMSLYQPSLISAASVSISLMLLRSSFSKKTLEDISGHS